MRKIMKNERLIFSLTGAIMFYERYTVIKGTDKNVKFT